MREIEDASQLGPQQKSKRCTKCGVEKIITEFAVKRQLKSGYASVCKECHNAYYKNYWKNTEAYEKHKNRVKKGNAEANLRHRLASSGIREEDYWALRKSGTCECCFKVRPLVFDHCHATGKFRGWICQSCNTAIGKMGDNANGVWQALDYLLKFETK